MIKGILVQCNRINARFYRNSTLNVISRLFHRNLSSQTNWLLQNPEESIGERNCRNSASVLRHSKFVNGNTVIDACSDNITQINEVDCDSSLENSKQNCVGYFFAKHIHITDLAAELKVKYEVRLDEGCAMVCLKEVTVGSEHRAFEHSANSLENIEGLPVVIVHNFGSVVFKGIESIECDSFLKLISIHCVSPVNFAKPRYNSHNSIDFARKIAVDYYSDQLDTLSAGLTDLLEKMSSPGGGSAKSMKEKQVVELLSRHHISLMDINQRVRVVSPLPCPIIDSKSSMIQSTSQLIMQLIKTAKGDRLEWVIIWLLFLEIGVAMCDLLDYSPFD